MSNALYPLIKEALIQGSVNSSLAGSGATGVYAALINTSLYTYSAADQFYSTSGMQDATVGTPVELTSKTFALGLFDAADSTFTAVTGAVCGAIGIYIKNAGLASTWRLVAYIDSGVVGLPVTPNGGDIGVVWNAAGIIQF